MPRNASPGSHVSTRYTVKSNGTIFKKSFLVLYDLCPQPWVGFKCVWKNDSLSRKKSKGEHGRRSSEEPGWQLRGRSCLQGRLGTDWQSPGMSAWRTYYCVLQLWGAVNNVWVRAWGAMPWSAVESAVAPYSTAEELDCFPSWCSSCSLGAVGGWAWGWGVQGEGVGKGGWQADACKEFSWGPSTQ